MMNYLRVFMFLALLARCGVLADPIQVAPTNPHYYFYQGKPILLITSAEHYGAVVNKDFDYVVYLDALQAHGLNYTRFYPGAMFEPVGKFMVGNTLGPKPGSLVVPWARSDTPGFRLDGNRFDLDRWDPAYFARFGDFLAQAARRAIIVEICFFNSQYEENKPIELNETGYFPLWYRGDKVADSRVEAWEFMVGGGAGFNHLNGLFTVENPAGKSPENERVLRALGNLKRFLEGFEFVRMAPDKNFLVSGVKPPQYHRAISEPGKQYALYIHHSSEKVGGSYTVVPGDYQEELEVKLPPGRYRAEWVDPETGSVLVKEKMFLEGGNTTLKTPPYKIDIALKMTRV